jgi:tetraacyldisaccharide 4'-kinase
MRAPEFWRHDGLVPRLLSPLATAWSVGGALRQRFGRPAGTAIPVICVGNLVVGGAGKTPVALALARLLREEPPGPLHFVSRGYGGREPGPIQVDPDRHEAGDVGDEALLLADAAPTWVARYRRAGVAAAASAGAGLVVLDDGFQDPSVAKALSLLVVDGSYGFGNGRLLPAGPLREPVTRGLRRADAVVLIGADRVGIAARLPPDLPILHARLVPGGSAESLRGQAVFGFAGIGRPEKFFETLAAQGCRVRGTRAFPDHHPYRPDEILAVCEAAAALRALPVTTEKDAVRLPPDARAMVAVYPVRLAWADPDGVGRLIASRLGSGAIGPGRAS